MPMNQCRGMPEHHGQRNVQKGGQPHGSLKIIGIDHLGRDGCVGQINLGKTTAVYHGGYQHDA